MILKLEDHVKSVAFNNDQGVKYLLQVWDREGNLQFERYLREKVVFWNVCGGTFLFTERND